MRSALSSDRVFKPMMGAVLLALSLFIALGVQKLWSQANTGKTTLAQKLVDQVAAKHRAEVASVSFYSIPPNGMSMVVVAATDPGMIGKTSEAQELSVVGGHSLLDLKDGSLVVLQKLCDRSGQTVGVAVMNLRLADGQETEAAKLSKTIDKELAQEIPSKAALFQPTP